MTKEKPFSIESHDTCDKRFTIYGPDILLYVDYDDVDHVTVDARAEMIVQVLNESWDRFGI